MFEQRRAETRRQSAALLAGLIYHATVRAVRKEHRHAGLGLALNILQALLMLTIFYLLFTVLGLRGIAIRGDFML